MHWNQASFLTGDGMKYSIPANSHALCVSLTPAGQFLTPDWKMWVVAWHNFQKYVNSDPCKEQKPCVKWVNDNNFLAISDFSRENHWERARVYSRAKTSEVFGLLRKTSYFFGNLREWSCRVQNSWHCQDKNLTLISQKKLAGICLREEGTIHLLVRSTTTRSQACRQTPCIFRVVPTSKI